MIRILLVSSKTVSIQGKIGTIKTKKMNTGRKNNPIFQPYGSNISRSSWRNDCASDSRSEGCVFESHRGQFPPTLEICSFLKNVSGKGLETFWGFVFPVKVPHFKEKITFLKHKKKWLLEGEKHKGINVWLDSLKVACSNHVKVNIPQP